MATTGTVRNGHAATEAILSAIEQQGQQIADVAAGVAELRQAAAAAQAAQAAQAVQVAQLQADSARMIPRSEGDQRYAEVTRRIKELETRLTDQGPRAQGWIMVVLGVAAIAAPAGCSGVALLISLWRLIHP